MRRRAIILGLAAAMTLSAGASAQEEQEEPQRVEQRMTRLQERLGEEATERMREIVQRAEQRGVPSGPLLDKALEGAAKGVPAERVTAALSAYAGRLGRGAELLGSEASSSEVVAAADALSRGVSGEAVREVARAAPSGGRAIPLVVLGDLAEAGVPVERAVGVVREALERGHAGEALLEVPARVRRMVRQGVPPAEAADRAPAMVGRRAGPPEGRPGAGQGSPHRGGAPPVPPGSGPPGDPGGGSGGQGGGGGGSGGGGGGSG